MPIEKLTAKQLADRQDSPSGYSEYVAFLQSLRLGQGGLATVEKEGVTRQTIKNRLNKSAEAAGVTIKFHRSGREEVIFELVKK